MELYNEIAMDTYTNIYMLGIKGNGMASLASLLKKMGKNVWGADVQTREPADELLDKVDIKVLPFGVANIHSDIDLLITTGSHGGLKNPEVIAAQEMGIPVLTHAEALGKLMESFKTQIAVCGTHGKTTTSALLAYLLIKMGASCGYQIGAPSFSGLPGGDYIGNEYFVVESDEYATSPGTDNTPRFMFQNPTHIICTNIEHEHVDIYNTIDETKSAFQAFFRKLPQGGAIVYCADDLILSEVVAESVTPSLTYGYGTTDGTYAYISGIHVDNGMSVFRLSIGEFDTGEWITPLSGEHNIKNITSVLVLLHKLGFNLDEVKKHLGNFSGSKRRFEHIYDNESYSLIDDYAHHPSEVRETLKGARMTYPGRRILVVFQPHTFSRTKVFKEEFAEVLSLADEAYILDVYSSARETAQEDSVQSQDIVAYAHSKGYKQIQYVREEQVIEALDKELKPGDVIVTMGATNLYRFHSDIMKAISKHTHD